MEPRKYLFQTLDAAVQAAEAKAMHVEGNSEADEQARQKQVVICRISETARKMDPAQTRQEFDHGIGENLTENSSNWRPVHASTVNPSALVEARLRATHRESGALDQVEVDLRLNQGGVTSAVEDAFLSIFPGANSISIRSGFGIHTRVEPSDKIWGELETFSSQLEETFSS